MLRDSLTYPVRKNGMYILVPGALLGLALVIGSTFGLILSAFPFVFGIAYFAAFYLSIIETTISGRDEPPDWPSPTGALDTVIMPAVVVFFITIVANVPMLSISWAWVEWFDLPESWVLPFLSFVLASAYIPMALISYVMNGGFGSLMPHRVLPAIARVMPGYLMLVLARADIDGMMYLMIWAFEKLNLHWMLILGLMPVLMLTFLYSLMVQGRLTGLFFLYYQTRLRW